MNRFLLILILTIMSLATAFAGGPTPKPVIGPDQIADGAVTLPKTSGVMATDGSNATTIADLPVTLINSVAPLTSAEKTQALVGSTTVDFLAKRLSISATETASAASTILTPGLAAVTNTCGFKILDTVSVPLASLTGVKSRCLITIVCTSGPIGYARYWVAADFSVTLIDQNATAFSGTDEAAKFCLYNNSSVVTLKNRSGATAYITINAMGLPQ